MRFLARKQFSAGLVACGTVFAFAQVAFAQNTLVETYTASGVFDFAMPGTPSGAGLTFTTIANVQTLDFSPGAVVFNGQPIDFDGTEPQFISSLYEATLGSPVNTGPGTFTVSGTGTIGVGSGGTGGGGGGGCMVVGGPITVGPTFDSAHLAVATGGGKSLRNYVPQWNFSPMPQLNGHSVTLDGALAITAVDPINGLVSFTSNGSILAGNEAVPALTTLGSICLAIGVFGLAILALSRRTLRRRDSSAV